MATVNARLEFAQWQGRVWSASKQVKLLPLNLVPLRQFIEASSFGGIFSLHLGEVLVCNLLPHYKRRPREDQGVIQMLRTNGTSYQPSEDEPFMNERQRGYFRAKLIVWKADILREARETLEALQEENTNHADLADRASSETDRSIELRARDRQRKLISKIDAAMARIDDGTYGFCEETGEPISLKRLDARPIATLSIEAQERHERREKVYRDE
jgi:DnaK suppressor protein